MLLIGRLVYEKGFQLALEAMPRVIEEAPGTRFLVAGSGTHEEELHRQAEELGLMEHGTFLGWIGDDVLHSLYRIADLTVVPSIYEPFGLVGAGGDGLRMPLHRRRHRRPARGRPARGGRPALPLPRPRSAGRGRDPRPLATTSWASSLVAEAYEHLRRFDWGDVAEQTAAVYAELVGEPSPA